MIDRDIVVKRLNAAGTAISEVRRIYTTQSTEQLTALALGPGGNIYLTGNTDGWEPDFPVTPGALHPICGIKRVNASLSCGIDAYLTVLSSGGDLLYSTYLGGYEDDFGRAVAVDPVGNIYVAGDTFSKDIETHNALQPTCPIVPTSDSCWHDIFVAKISPDGQNYLYSTYLNSTETNRSDFVRGLVVDAGGNAYLTGFTNGDHFPTLDAFQPNLAIGICLNIYNDRFCYDAFVTKLSPSGSLVYSSYLGGRQDELPGGIAIDAAGNAYVVGETKSFDFPTTPTAFQPNISAMRDFFLAKAAGVGAPPPPPPPGNYRAYPPGVIR